MSYGVTRVPQEWRSPSRLVVACALAWVLFPASMASPVEGQVPTNLVAAANGDTAIDLSWTAPSLQFQTVNGYKIQVTTDTTGTWTDLVANTNSTATEYTHRGLTPDTTLHYRVRAFISNFGTPTLTGPSNIATATTEMAAVQGTPSAPTNFKADASSNTTIDLVWDEPADTGSSAVTEYVIEASPNGTDDWVELEKAAEDARDYLHTGLTPDTTVYYRIAAANDEGMGEYTDVESATTLSAPGTPGPPDSLRVTEVGRNFVRLNWAPPSDTGGSAVLFYGVEVAHEGESDWTDLAFTPSRRFVHTDLTPDTTLQYRVFAENRQGRGTPSAAVEATTEGVPEGAPGRPRNLMAEPSETAIDLRWDQPAQTGGGLIPVLGYQIEMSPANRVDWVVQDSVETPDQDYRVEGLTPDTTLRFRVRAFNNSGVGEPSNIVTATTLEEREEGVPGAPTRLTAKADGQTAIDLEWTAPSDTGSSAVTGYRIEVSSNAGSTWSNLTANTGSTDTSARHRGLQPGTTRHYRVSAINSAGTGATSNIAHATTAGDGDEETTVPGAPRNLTANARGESRIDLSWTAPASDGNSAITGYRIEVSANAGQSWTTLASNTGSTSTLFSHTGLSSASTRHYRVSAINAEGAGPVSNVATATTGGGVPGAPTGLVAAARGQSRIDLTWTAPTNDGGSAVTGYRIEYSENGGQSWLVLVNNTASTATTYSNTGLSPGTRRHYRVSAINGQGVGPVSNVAFAATGSTVPGAPTNLTAASQGQSQIGLSWTAPASDGGSPIVGYRIEVSENSGVGWTVLVQNTATTATTYSHNGLESGTTRHYRVSALNAAGVGPASNVAHATTGASAPDAPKSLTAKANGTSQIDLSWTAPDNDGGSPITGYRVEASSDDSPGWITLVDNTGSAATLHSHANLSPATTWRYRVQAINAVGTGPASGEARATTAAALPEAPTELAAAARGPSWIELAWKTPDYTGGVPIAGYKIEVYQDEGSIWTVLVPNTRSTGTGYHHLGLDPGSTHYYRVSAINSAGVGPVSGVAQATTDPVVPGKPTGLKAMSMGTSRIDLAWDIPDYDGGAPISGYRIEGLRQDDTQWRVLVANTGTSATAYSHTGLRPASSWTYRVSAVNPAGHGDPSTMARATTDPEVPDAPVDLVAKADGTSRIDLAWKTPPYDGGAPITGYRVEVSENAGSSWSILVADTRSTTTSYPHVDLSPASTRHYRVSAINRAGTSAPSATAFATTDATVPDPPTGISASARDHSQIDLSWKAPEFDGGSRITGYRIQVSENAGLDWKDLVANTGSTNTAYEHSGLRPATTRHYRVSAINRIGVGDPSGVVSATTDATVPDAPEDLVAVPTAPTRIDLVWRAPAYDGGARVTSYRVEVSQDGERWGDLAASTGQNTTSYAHTGLRPGSTWFYRVSAINIAGTSLPSNVASASTDDPVERAGRVNEAVLPRFAAAMTTSTFAAIAGRIEALAGGSPLASQSRAAGLPSAGGIMASSSAGGDPSLRHLLNGASFALPLGRGPAGQQTGLASRIGTWGGAEYHSMGEPAGEEVEWEGDMLTVHVGLDVRVHRNLLAGVAGSRSSGDYDFTDMTGNREVGGTYHPRMNSVSPYVAWLPGSTGVVIWTAGSFGWGQVSIEDEIAGIRYGDLRAMTGALGGSRILMSNASSSLRVRAEGWLSRHELPAAEGMDSLTLEMSRAKAALEWAQEYDFESGSKVSLVAEGGVRYSLGSGTDGTRMEVGGGLRYLSPSGRVMLEGHGRSLVAAGTGYEERGFRGLIQVAMQGEDRGLSLRLRPVWGNATSRVQELWDQGLGDGPGRRLGDRGARLHTEIEYGLPSIDGTPYGRFNIAQGGTRALATGMRYQVGQDLHLRVEGSLARSTARFGRPGIALRGRWKF